SARAGSRLLVRFRERAVVGDQIVFQDQPAAKGDKDATHRVDETAPVALDAVVVQLELFHGDQRDAAVPDGDAGAEGLTPQLQLQTADDAVPFHVQAAHDDGTKPPGEEPEGGDAALAHAEDVVVEDANVEKVAVGNGNERVASWASRRGRVGIGVDA